MRTIGLIVGIAVALLSAPAQAYIGPGAGAGVIAVVFGVIGSIFLAFVAILWYPIKRLLKRGKSGRKPATNSQT